MKKRIKILIIGGTGFIGYHLIKRCLKKSFLVTSVSSKPPVKSRKLSKVKYLICDIRNEKKLKRIIKSSFNYVVNLGGYVNHYKKKETFTSHYYGCKNISKLFLKTNIDHFIQIGSGLEYGNQKSPQRESFACSAISNYGQAKLKATKYLLKLTKQKKFPCTVLRLYQAYGPNQDFNRLIPVVIKSCLKKETFNCTEGLQKRDFLFIDDLIDLIFKVFEKKKYLGGVFNAGSGKSIKIRNLIEKIKKISKGGKPEYGKIKMRKDEIKAMYPDIKLSKKIFNWHPKVSLNKGLKKTIKFYSEKY